MLGLLIALTPQHVVAAQVCEEPSSTLELRTLLEDAEDAYSRLDVAAFKAATDSARALLPCLSEPLPRTLAASFHRAMGLRLFVDRDSESAQLAFAAARSVEPLYRFPTTLVPEGHPVRVQYGAYPVELGEYLPVAQPAGRITFDGTDVLQRPLSWPSIVQIYDEAGQIVETHYLQPAEPMPGYPLATGDVIRGGVIREGLQFHPQPTKPLLAGAAGVALLTGGLYLINLRQWNAYWDDETTQATDYDAYRARTNGLVVGTWVGGTAAVVLGTGAFFVAEW